MFRVAPPHQRHVRDVDAGQRFTLADLHALGDRVVDAYKTQVCTVPVLFYQTDQFLGIGIYPLVALVDRREIASSLEDLQPTYRSQMFDT